VEIKTDSKLEKILKSGQMAVTSECGPPRSSDPAGIIEKGEMIKDHVDSINITDNQTSVTRLCSLAACVHLKLKGLDPVLQMVVRDRNRIALQSDILGAASSQCSLFRQRHICVMKVSFSVETRSRFHPICL